METSRYGHRSKMVGPFIYHIGGETFKAGKL